MTEDFEINSIEELEEAEEFERQLKIELDRYAEECGEVVSYNRGFCRLPDYGDWRDKQYGLRVWSREVRKRDGHKCRKRNCGSKKDLHAHHIYNQADNPDIRFEVWNGITLCQSCHILFHRIYGKVGNNEDQIKEFISSENEGEASDY